MKDNELDFLIVTALEDELEAVTQIFSEFKTAPFGPKTDDFSPEYFFKEGYKIIAISFKGMGRVRAALKTAKAIHYWNPQVILLVGITGGIRHKVHLGDVLIPKDIYDYELRKLKKVKKDGVPKDRDDDWRGDSPKISDILLEHSSDRSLKGFKAYIKQKRPTVLREKSRIKLHHGKIVASGDKSVSVSEIMEGLQKERNQLLGIEMEGAGVASAVSDSNLPPAFLMIKAVSDYADEKADDEDTQEWRKYACIAAAAAAKKLIEVLIENQIYKPFPPDPIAPLLTIFNRDKVNYVLAQGYPIIFMCDFFIYRDLAITISSIQQILSFGLLMDLRWMFQILNKTTLQIKTSNLASFPVRIRCELLFSILLRTLKIM